MAHRVRLLEHGCELVSAYASIHDRRLWAVRERAFRLNHRQATNGGSKELENAGRRN